MINRYTVLVLFCILASTFILRGQGKIISGIVTSKEDHLGIPGATVRVEGRIQQGTTTDLNGRFALEVPAETKNLIISFVGYITQTVSVAGQSEIQIVLLPDVQTLEGVVVTALGIKREKKALGYSIQEIDAEELNTVKDISVVNQLHGKVSGMQISETTGGPGSSSRIIIRGNTSLDSDNQALIVVDGIPISNNTVNTTSEWGGLDYGNGISDINPDDIESVSVLKGASATALYGSMAANGVILITTKKGTQKSGLGVQLNTGASLVQAYIHTQFQDAYGAGRNGKFEGPWRIENGIPVYNTDSDAAFGSWGPKMEGQTIVDWDGETKKFLPQANNYKDHFQTGLNLNNAFALEGGNQQSSFRFSYANLYNSDIVPNTQLNRHNFNLSSSAQLSKNLKATASVNYINQKAENRLGLSNSYSLPRNIIMMPRHISDESLKNHIMDPDGYEQVWYTNWNWMSNPYWMHEYELNDDTRDRVLAASTITYTLNKKLNLRIRGNTDLVWHRFNSRQAYKGISDAQGGARAKWLNSKILNGDALLTYQSDIGNQFKLSSSIGVMTYYSKLESEDAWTKNGLSIPYFYNVDYGNEKESAYLLQESQINSVFATAQLAYRSWLFFDMSHRIDQSSTLPRKVNTYYYPSFSLGFVFTDALEWESDWMPFGKIRASWAQVGSDADPYQLQKTFIQQGTFNGVPYTHVQKFAPPYDLKPEISTATELGTDLRFFNNRIRLDASWYRTSSRNQILPMDVSNASGVNQAIINTGEILNQGIELLIEAAPIKKTNGLHWDIALNWAKNSSKVVSLHHDLENYVLLSHWRMTVEARPGHNYGDLVGYGIKRDADGNKLVDENGLYIRDEKSQVLGNIQADFFGGIRNNLHYHNWSMGFLVDVSVGGELFSGTNMYGYGYSGNLEGSLEGREAWYASEAAREAAGIAPEDWTPTGGYPVEGVTETGTRVSTFVNPEKYWGQFSSWTNEIHEPFIYDASFIKLREFSISYRIPNALSEKLKLQSAVISLVGRNLWLIYSGAENIDPESYYTNGNGQGFELYSYPTRRSIGFNLKFNF